MKLPASQTPFKIYHHSASLFPRGSYLFKIMVFLATTGILSLLARRSSAFVVKPNGVPGTTPLLLRRGSRSTASLTTWSSQSYLQNDPLPLIQRQHANKHPQLGRTSGALYFSTQPSETKELSSSSSPVPMTLLSGFLGTGKTTALKYLLENKENLKIGVIVNDVASVNIDAKLVSGQTADMVELQNGCACCSLADELFSSVDKLLQGRELDAIVVELSGVADPMAIKSNWRMAPITVRSKADIARVVTLVDAGTFGSDYMTWDVAGERPQWTDPGDDCSANRKVAELLAEQVEAANLVLVNKIDLATEEEVKIASSMARALNKDAVLKEVEFGRMSPLDLIATIQPEIVVGEENSHDHGHSHEEACHDPKCTDPSHSHSHDHHEHQDTKATDCTDLDCTDTSHSHSHEHSSDTTNACADASCNDPTHSHDHSHSHSHSTSTEELGIKNFVYKATKPFDPRKLMNVLNRWPIPIKDKIDVGLLTETDKEDFQVGGSDSPFAGVLRSKGFCWFAPLRWSGTNGEAWRHDTAMYWSHAGKHFSVTAAGKWWGTISKDQMKKFFIDNEEEYQRILREDFVTNEFGDRRQELVFIGSNIDEEKITKTLDDCLVTDKEMEKYRQNLQNYMDTILSTSSGAGLFDVGSVDHTDGKQ